MGFGISIFMFAAGLIMTIAIPHTAGDQTVYTIGLILTLVGILGMVLAFLATILGRRTKTEIVAPQQPQYMQQPQMQMQQPQVQPAQAQPIQGQTVQPGQTYGAPQNYGQPQR